VFLAVLTLTKVLCHIFAMQVKRRFGALNASLKARVTTSGLCTQAKSLGQRVESFFKTPKIEFRKTVKEKLIGFVDPDSTNDSFETRLNQLQEAFDKFVYQLEKVENEDFFEAIYNKFIQVRKSITRFNQAFKIIFNNIPYTNNNTYLSESHERELLKFLVKNLQKLVQGLKDVFPNSDFKDFGFELHSSVPTLIKIFRQPPFGEDLTTLIKQTTNFHFRRDWVFYKIRK
jgi:hypothetical protein